MHQAETTDLYFKGDSAEKEMIHTYHLCFTLSPFQAAVEVPQYMGVNLLVKGAPIKRSRLPLHRRTVISNALLIQFPSEHLSSKEVKTRHKPSGQKSCAVSTVCHSDKENQPIGEKKKQLTLVSTKRDHEGITEVQNNSCVRKSCCNLLSEWPLVISNEPHRKA